MDEKEIYKMIRRNRRKDKIRNFLRKSKLVWILDPDPYETHELLPRSVVENFKRDRLRQIYSWHNISRLQNEKVYKAGLAGIITAPILASFANMQPSYISFEFPRQMAFVFLSGILFVLAGVFYNFRVPNFVKTFMETDEDKKYKVMPMRGIRSSISLEFLKLGRAVEITSNNIHELSDHQMAFETAGLLLNQGGRCYKVGFDVVGQAKIEKLLYKLAKKHSFKIYEEYKMNDGEIGLRKRSGPFEDYAEGEVHLRHLKIESVKDHFVTNLSQECLSCKYSDCDIVIEFYDPYIQTPDQIDKKHQLEPYTHGLDVILREDYLDTFIEELSYWQSGQRSFSRVLALWIYRFSLLSFAIFLFYQASVVWDAINI